jgi:hypothetical protein
VGRKKRVSWQREVAEKLRMPRKKKKGKAKEGKGILDTMVRRGNSVTKEGR